MIITTEIAAIGINGFTFGDMYTAMFTGDHGDRKLIIGRLLLSNTLAAIRTIELPRQNENKPDGKDKYESTGKRHVSIIRSVCRYCEKRIRYHRDIQ